MPRPATPLGCHGEFSYKEVRPGHWVAKVWFRDWDGVSRPVTASGATKAKSKAALQEKLKGRRAPVDEAITRDSKICALWAAYRKTLIESNPPIRTRDTYEDAGATIVRALGEVRIKELRVQLLHDFLRKLKPGTAHQCRSVLSNMCKLAIVYEALDRNLVRDVPKTQPGKSKRERQEEIPMRLDGDYLEHVVHALRNSSAPCPQTACGKPVDRSAAAEQKYPAPTVSEYAKGADLVDLVVMFAGTGLRIGELLGVLWGDVDFDGGTVKITGKVIRAKRIGVIREDYLKTRCSERTIALPDDTIAMLKARHARRGEIGAEKFSHPKRINPAAEKLDLVFPAANGAIRDPGGVQKQWRRVRSALELGGAVPHSFRHALVTMLEDEKVPATWIADQLGHAHINTLHEHYYERGKVRPEVADIYNRRIGQKAAELGKTG